MQWWNLLLKMVCHLLILHYFHKEKTHANDEQQMDTGLRWSKHTQNCQTLHLWINIAFAWQGEIDLRPTWDFKMKTAGVFSGGGCRVTERCTRWWNRQAGRDVESRASARPRTLRDWVDSIEEPLVCGCCCWKFEHSSPAVLRWVFLIERHILMGV